jgi:hypothetical protein
VTAERVPYQALARAPVELPEAHHVDVAVLPEARERVAHLRPRQGQHEQRTIAQAPQRRVDVRHGRQVTPVQALEHQHHRLNGALCVEEILERAAHLIAHQRGILARGAELDALVVRERRARELAEELGDAPVILAGEVPADAGADLLPPCLERLA